MAAVSRVRATAICVVLAFTAAACSDSGTKPSELSESSTTSAAPSGGSDQSSVPPTADAEEQAVIAAYKGWFEAVNGMGLATDEQVAEALAPYGTDEIVQKTVTVFASKRAEGLIPGGDVVFGTLEVVLDDTSAVVRECRDGSTESSIAIATGDAVAFGAPGTKYEAVMTKAAGDVWRIADYSALEGQC